MLLSAILALSASFSFADGDPKIRKHSSFSLKLPGFTEAYNLSNLESVNIDISRLNEKSETGKDQFYLRLSAGHDIYSSKGSGQFISGFRLNPSVDAKWKIDAGGKKFLDVQVDTVSAFGIFNQHERGSTYGRKPGVSSRMRFSLANLGVHHVEDETLGWNQDTFTSNVNLQLEQGLKFGSLPFTMTGFGSIGVEGGDISVDGWKNGDGQDQRGGNWATAYKVCGVIGIDAGPVGSVKGSYELDSQQDANGFFKSSEDGMHKLRQNIRVGVDEIGGKNMPIDIGVYYECERTDLSYNSAQTVSDGSNDPRIETDVPTQLESVRVEKEKIEHRLGIQIGF